LRYRSSLSCRTCSMWEGHVGAASPPGSVTGTAPRSSISPFFVLRLSRSAIASSLAYTITEDTRTRVVLLSIGTERIWHSYPQLDTFHNATGIGGTISGGFWCKFGIEAEEKYSQI